MKLGSWSGFTKYEQNEIGNILVNSNKQHFPNKNIQILFNQLYTELSNDGFGSNQLVNHKLDELFISVIRSMQINENENISARVTKIFELEKKITNDLSYNWKLADMAEILSIGQTSLNILIKRETGFSPGQYLVHLRVLKAKELLQNSDKNITEIAFDCGFCSSQHFSASFKQKTGFTPISFRKKGS